MIHHCIVNNKQFQPFNSQTKKNTNIFLDSVFGQTAELNSRQYFRLYGIVQLENKETCLVKASCSSGLCHV